MVQTYGLSKLDAGRKSHGKESGGARCRAVFVCHSVEPEHLRFLSPEDCLHGTLGDRRKPPIWVRCTGNQQHMSSVPSGVTRRAQQQRGGFNCNPQVRRELLLQVGARLGQNEQLSCAMRKAGSCGHHVSHSQTQLTPPMMLTAATALAALTARGT